MFAKLHLMWMVRVHWVEAYLAHHRQDIDEFIYHENLMRRYERELELLEIRRRFA